MKTDPPAPRRPRDVKYADALVNLDWLIDITRVLEGSPVTVLELGDGELEIKLVRSAAAAPRAEPAGIGMEPALAGPADHWITAPRVGVYHQPQRPVHPGDRINPGEIVGFIEAMRILNEVQAQASGIVLEVKIEDGYPVEYGQELFLIREVAEDGVLAGG